MAARYKFPWRLVGPITIITIAAVLLSAAKAETENAQTAQRGEIRHIDEASELRNKEAPNTIKGFVTDELGRSRGHVYVVSSGMKIWDGVRSDAWGQFALEDVQPGPRCWIAYSHHSRSIGLFKIPEQYDGQPTHVILDLTEAEAEGRVVDTMGNGLAGRKVELGFISEAGLTYVSPPLETDKHGYYRYEPCPCGSDISVRARLIPQEPNEAGYVTPAQQLSDRQIYIELLLMVVGGKKQQPEFDKNLGKDGHVLYSGRIVNEKGEPISEVEVELNFDMGGRYTGRSVMTDEKGQWHRRLPVNHSNLFVRLSHPDYISYHFDESSRKPAKSELLDGTSVMVMKRGLRLSGKVLNEQGNPVENALVTAGRLYSSSGGKIIEDCTTARTVKDGSFSIGGLPEKKIDIFVSALNYAPNILPVEMQAKMQPISVKLKKGRTYQGQIVDKKGNPLEGVGAQCFEWRLGKNRRRLTRITKTDSNGYFSIEDVPDEGTLRFIFEKKKSGFMHFAKKMPEDLSGTDRIVMYKEPLIAGKVIDAGTEEPITDFEVISGCKWESTDEDIFWSRYARNKVKNQNGKFSIDEYGVLITYPFDGAFYVKIVADGYYPEISPAVKLGEPPELFVIRMTKAEPLKGTVVDPQGNPAVGAEVALVTPGKKAFIQNGRFDRGGFVRQVESIFETDQKGRFELTPTRQEGVIVTVHETGYAQVKSTEFEDGSEIQLFAWARIEGTIYPEAEKGQVTVGVRPILPSEDKQPRPIEWFFDASSLTGKEFAIDYLPSIPMYVGKFIRWEHSNPVYLRPEPGQTYKIKVGGKGSTVKGKILPQASKEDGEILQVKMSNPRRVHAVAYRIEPEPSLPGEIENISRSSFQWQWRDTESVYEKSKIFQKRFIPTIDDEGYFVLDNLPAGKYEFVINIHAPLGENVSCGRGVLKAVGMVRFTVKADRTEKVTELAPIETDLLCYPEVGSPAPLFKVESLDGEALSLEDLRGKVTLLDFWATWCSPCVEKMPKLKELYDTFGADDRFVMIGMSVDWDVERLKKFVEEKGLQWPQVCLGGMSESKVVSKYGVGGIPTYILIGPDGKIKAKNLSIEQLKSAVAKALKNNTNSKTDVHIEIEKH
jgi:peroxiredoxin